MQDLAAGMTRPCGVSFVMGTRTIIPNDAVQKELEAIDQASSTASLGFRIDAGRMVLSDDSLEALPLPSGKESLNDLQSEDDLVQALGTFLQQDANLCKAVLIKLEGLQFALERSAFFAEHVLLRSTLLLVYDDAARTKVELRMINFGFSYPLPEGAPAATHTAKWDGSAASHEDGYLIGVKSLIRVSKRLHADLEIRL